MPLDGSNWYGPPSEPGGLPCAACGVVNGHKAGCLSVQIRFRITPQRLKDIIVNAGLNGLLSSYEVTELIRYYGLRDI